MFSLLWCQRNVPAMSPHLKFNLFMGVVSVQQWHRMHVLKGGAFAYTCTATRVVSMLFVDTVKSPQSKKNCVAAKLLLWYTERPRGSAASHLTTSSDIKLQYYSTHVFSC